MVPISGYGYGYLGMKTPAPGIPKMGMGMGTVLGQENEFGGVLLQHLSI